MLQKLFLILFISIVGSSAYADIFDGKRKRFFVNYGLNAGATTAPRYPKYSPSGNHAIAEKTQFFGGFDLKGGIGFSDNFLVYTNLRGFIEPAEFSRSETHDGMSYALLGIGAIYFPKSTANLYLLGSVNNSPTYTTGGLKCTRQICLSRWHSTVKRC